MLVVRVELHCAMSDRVEELGTIIIANDGSGDSKVGNYDVRVGRKGCSDFNKIYHKPTRSGKVLGHKRFAESVWSLVARALESVKF